VKAFSNPDLRKAQKQPGRSHAGLRRPGERAPTPAEGYAASPTPHINAAHFGKVLAGRGCNPAVARFPAP
jgi:hypothetical protein